VPTISARLAQGMVTAGIASGRKPSAELLEPFAWLIYSSVQAMATTDYMAARAGLARLTRDFLERWSWDVLLIPAIGRRPLPARGIDCGAGDLRETARRAGDLTRFTSLF